MRNYFSQLAKQSGLRFSGTSEKTRPVNVAPDAPLEQERTILVEPDLPELKTTEHASETSPAHFPKTEKSPENFASVNAETSIENSKKRVGEATKIETSRLEIPETKKTLPNKPVLESVHQNQAENFSEKEFVEPPTVEQIVFKESGAPDREDISESPKLTGESETEKPAPPHSAPQYFKKTGELLEKGGEPNRSEIQQILLREVQEWVAETPELTGAESEVIEAKEPRVKVSPPPVEEKTVFGETRAERQSEKQGLEEQNLNLSIGTISIVVEEADKKTPPENVLPKTPGETGTAERKRQFSRLSRNYL